MFITEDHDPSPCTQMQKNIYDFEHRLSDDNGKVDRPRSYYHLRKESDGRKGGRLTRLEELEAENLQLREAISNLRLDKLCLQESVRALPGLFRDH
jgi:hypothetical protein